MAEGKRKSAPTLRRLIDLCNDAESRLEDSLRANVDLGNIEAIRDIWVIITRQFFEFRALSKELEGRHLKLGNTENYNSAKTNRFEMKDEVAAQRTYFNQCLAKIHQNP